MQNYGAVVISGLFAVLCFGLGLPLALRKVPRNYVYGFRLNRYVMENDDIWFEVNSAGGWELVAASPVLLAIAVIAAFYIGNVRIQSDLMFVLMFLTIAGAALMILKTFRLSHRLAEEKGLRPKP
jgi:hypothetical protein